MKVVAVLASLFELILTAGIGSDHIDLGAAATSKITVAEITDTKH